LGTHTGFSYLCFCQAIDQLRTGTHAFAIDTWEGDSHSGLYDESVLVELRELHDEPYGSFSRLVQEAFDEAVNHFEDGSIDLLHIDGRHFYDDVRHDFETWLPKLSDKGVVALHDVNVREREFGVDRFWRELRDSYPTFEFRDDHGLGIVGVGEDQPDEMVALFNAQENPDLAITIRSVYQRLGRAITTSVRAEDLDIELRDLSAHAADLSAHAADLSTHIEGLSTHIEGLSTHIEGLTARIDELSDQVATAEQARTEADATVDRTHRSNAELLSERERLNLEHANVVEQLGDASIAVTDSEERLKASAAEIGRLEQELNNIYESKAWRIASLRWRSG
jgi:methyl-accepting chemotaxis protein